MFWSSEEYLVFPILKNLIHFIYGKKIIFGMIVCLQEYDQQSLLKLFFPEKSHLNKFRITPIDLINENYLKVEKFLDFYKKKKL